LSPHLVIGLYPSLDIIPEMMSELATALLVRITRNHARENKGKLLSVLAGECKHLKEGNSLYQLLRKACLTFSTHPDLRLLYDQLILRSESAQLYALGF
jgi:hypothetical protein